MNIDSELNKLFEDWRSVDKFVDGFLVYEGHTIQITVETTPEEIYFRYWLDDYESTSGTLSEVYDDLNWRVNYAEKDERWKYGPHGYGY